MAIMKDSAQGAENHTETWTPTVSKANVEGDAANLDKAPPQNQKQPEGS